MTGEMKKIKLCFWKMLRCCVGKLVINPITRRFLNMAYSAFSFKLKQHFHVHFRKLFEDGKTGIQSGCWNVTFCEKKIMMPLSAERFEADWNMAVAILGNDVEVKRTYQTFLENDRFRTRVFFDVGANNGLHSLLFLAHGVQVVSFEPNPACNYYFNRLCEANRFKNNIQNFAVGDKTGVLELNFPENETWLGTTNTFVKDRITSPQIKKIFVDQIVLDGFVSESGIVPDLIKIDVEGSELGVLKGAMHIILSNQPSIIFECFAGADRKKIFDFFQGVKYEIALLPLLNFDSYKFLSEEAFLKSQALNFIALSRAGNGRITKSKK